MFSCQNKALVEYNQWHPAPGDKLLIALQHAAKSGEAFPGKRDQYGQRYVIDFAFTGPVGTATIRSAWIIGPRDLVPRFVTCYIL